MHDPRFRYRVQCDAEMERGEPGAWDRYLRAAELCERPPEEWELERAKPKKGAPAYVRAEITSEALLRAGSRSAQNKLIGDVSRLAFKQLVAVGVDERSIGMMTRRSAERDVLEITLHGVFR